jgi:uncharacterized 2Fe-2S/4Fe-4S cluster protein (DUF4445 family)
MEACDMAAIRFIPEDKVVTVADGTNLLEAARKAGVFIAAPCDGSGTCGKCRVKIPAGQRQNFKEAPHEWLTQAERADGWALACQSTIHGDLQVEPDQCADDDLKILSDGQSVAVELDSWITKTFDASTGQTTVAAGGVFMGNEPGDTTRSLFGVAVDIGTTTLVVALIDLRDGRELSVASSLNPQARHAQDVLSRIKLGSQPDGLQLLQRELIAELNRLISEAAGESNVPLRHIYEAVFSGNTTMLHLATGTNPASLGKYPYTPALQCGGNMRAAEIGLAIAAQGQIYLPPIMSAYVGADITSGILAAKLAELRGVTLFVDIGTNGEMVLAVNGTLTATSTAAGPAFEGMNIACGMRASRGAIEMVSLSGNNIEIKTIANAPPVGLCGSGLLDIVGELAAHGGVDKNGRFQSNGTLPDRPWKNQFGSLNGKLFFRIADPVYLSQKDVRQVQLAKAAVRAGIELMLRANGLAAARVDRVLIAGSFGFHLRTASLIHLGLLPREFKDRVDFVGNTSKSGARTFLLNRRLRDELKQLVQRVRVLELANDPAFEKTFVQALSF